MIELMEAAAAKLHDLHDPAAAVVWFDSAGSDMFAVSDLTYWASEHTRADFEKRAAARAVKNGWTRWAFATQMIIADTHEQLLMREPNPNLPPRDRVEGEEYGEVEIVWIVACDLEEGLEVGRVDVNSDGSLGHLLTLQGEHRVLEGSPGHTLIREVVSNLSV